ncbi:alpha/beta-hydrolase [Thozetella sp. PMI_491]|nr:alpha/beta-hydrolase [Thozetella sp. PMI_491]
MTSFATLAALFSGLVAAAAARNCHNLTIPVTISSTNQALRFAPVTNNVEVSNFVLNFLQPGGNFVAENTEGNTTVSGTYNIAATYCQPCGGPGKTIQVLTHGIGFDRNYWDFSFNGYNYSYVNRALERGYSTLFYDRLSVGESSHGEPVNELQAALEVESLRALSQALRNGTVPGISTLFEKVVHVGHSFGSIQTYGLAAKYPEETDGIVLTGFAQTSSFVALFGYAANFALANTLPGLSAYPDGYIAISGIAGIQLAFFAPDQFDPLILDAATAARQPVTIGELATLPGPVSTINQFRGPVLVVTGDRDLPFCGGNCSPSTPSIPAQVQEFFPSASAFEVVVIPEAGHGLNLEYSHPTTYGAILDFVEKHI